MTVPLTLLVALVPTSERPEIRLSEHSHHFSVDLTDLDREKVTMIAKGAADYLLENVG